MSAQGGLPRGGCVNPSMHWGRPPVNRMTDKNITFPQLRLRTVITLKSYHIRCLPLRVQILLYPEGYKIRFRMHILSFFQSVLLIPMQNINRYRWFWPSFNFFFKASKLVEMEVNLPNALRDIHMIRFVLLLKHWNRVAKERRGMNVGCTKETG